MAYLLHCPYTTELLQPRPMDVIRPRARPHHHLLTPRTPSCLLASYRFLSPYIWHHIPAANMCRFSLYVGNCNSLKTYPVMSMTKGHSVTSCKGLCEVVWTIEADLAAGQLLYLTGDPIVLGCWEPEMAILMSPSEHANLWKAEVKVASGVNFKYNYFIKGETWSSSDIIWRPGPEFSLSVPLSVKQDGKVVVRDLWTRFHATRSPAHFWGSWIEETCLPMLPSISAPARDEDEIVKRLESDVKDSKPFLNDLTVKNKLYSDDEVTIGATHKGSNPNLKTYFFEREQPVEEPWLLHSSLFFLGSKDKMKPDVSEKENTIKDEVIQLEINDQHCQVTEKLLPDMSEKENTIKDEVIQSQSNDQHCQVTEKLLPDESSLSLKEDSVSTIILINSSICTMQRIAVLEDWKLVELLLEPVKSNVQCDSVYLGVVSKLVPHMGGAFVNIGSSRHSLMDIKQKREPFIFPPFRRSSKKEEVSGSVFGASEEHPAAHQNEHTSHNVEVTDSQDDSVQFMHNYPEELHADNDFVVTEILNMNVNGSIVDHGEVEVDFEDYIDGEEYCLEGGSINSSLPVEIEDSNHSQTPRPQDMKDSNYTLNSENKWTQVRKGTKIIVQVIKEGLGTKGPTLTAYPKLRSRFWILLTRCERVGVSKKISGVERTRLKVIAKTLQPQGFGLTVRTVAAGHSLEELQKDLEGLLSTWKNIIEHAKSAALAADEGVKGAIPVILHMAMGQTLSVVQDYFNEKVKKMVVDSPRTYHEVTNYLQEIAPDLCDRVELYNKRIPLFDEFNIEEEINSILSKRVPLPNGGSLVIEQTEALVSIDVNGGHGMFGHGTSPEKANLDVNLAAAKQIARELRLRDIGGIIVVDFIDMTDDSNKRLVYEEVMKAVERDRSIVKVSELSRHGLMEMTRKRVRPSVTFMISEPCACCHATGRVEALETSFSKIEQEICRLIATMDQEADPENPKSWPRFVLRVDNHMCNYLTSGKRTRLAILSSSLKVWILLKVARGFTRGEFEVKLFTDEKANKNQHQVAISMLRQAEARTESSGKNVTLVPVKKYKASKK